MEDSDAFADYRTQQISWAEYEANIDEFGRLVDLPTEPKAFVAHVKNWLLDITQKTDESDKSFSNNQSVRLEQGRPVLKRPKKKVDPKKLAIIESFILCPKDIKPDVRQQFEQLCLDEGFELKVVREVSPPEVQLINDTPYFLVRAFQMDCAIAKPQ